MNYLGNLLQTRRLPSTQSGLLQGNTFRGQPMGVSPIRGMAAQQAALPLTSGSMYQGPFSELEDQAVAQGQRVSSGLGGVARGIGGAFTGEGSSARLSALGASLLQGPSRTPISLGSSLAQGLLAGNIAAQQEEDRRFNRSLLEQKAQAEADKLKLEQDKARMESASFGGLGKSAMEAEQKLRKEYDARSKDYREARTGYSRVISAGTAKAPTGADDIALIFGFMKTVDPGSVVRESEFSLAQDTGAAPEKAKAFINRVARGERLTPMMRRYFVEAAGRQFAGIQGPQRDLEERYKQIAESYNLNSSRVVQPLSATFKGVQEVPVGSASEPHKVSSQSEGESLPKGSIFLVEGEQRAQVVE